jgi:hypothetical protein
VRYEGSPELPELSKPVGWAVELADIVIRVCDTAAETGVDLEAAIRA